MNKLQAMEVFVQVVDAGGFTRAAENMRLPKATVSTLVQALERTLSAKLLNRTTRHVSVTAEGADYYERCIRVLSQIRDAEDALAHNRLNPTGRLRIDVATWLASEVIVPALPAFLAMYPEIQLEIGCGDRPVDLVEEGVDCAIRGGRQLADSRLIARRIGTVRYRTCASPAYLERHGRPLHPSELTQHQCINYFSARTGQIFDWYFARESERIQVTLSSPVALNDSSAYTVAGVAGLGIVQMAEILMTPMILDSRLIPVLEEWTNDPLPIYVVYPQNRHLSAKLRVFVEWVTQLFAAHPDLH
ncbi:LysR family transcriptional regulator [Pseudomonas sp. NPDC089554]|uniref:LysR family transcriptional regulator n=1 Tax=Pseudomonas sp. NPDC089554 TaxID=3390653 RepID=UPI003D047918